MSTQLRLSRSGFRVIFALTLLCGCYGQETYRVVTNARFAQAGPDESLFTVSLSGSTTQGAWMRDCSSGMRLARLDGRTGELKWATCLPFQIVNFAVDARGAVTMVGYEVRLSLAPTDGAYTSPGGGRTQVAVVRLKPDGSGPEFVATLRGMQADSQAYFGRVALGPDGSIYGYSNVRDAGMPTTAEALQTQKPQGRDWSTPYFFRLSGDGSRLLYATWLGPLHINGVSGFDDLVVDGEGNVFLGGYVSVLHSAVFPATPGSYTTPVPEALPIFPGFVARFDPETARFRYISVFGGDISPHIRLAALGRGRVAVGMRDVTRGDAQPTVVRALNADGSELEFSRSVGSGMVIAMAAEANGGLSLVSVGPGPVTADATALPSPFGATLLLKLSAGGTRVVYSTATDCPDCTEQHGAVRSGSGWLLAADSRLVGDNAGPPRPVVVETGEPRTLLMAVPDHFEVCDAIFNENGRLFWDTRDPRLTSVEMRVGSPRGELLSRDITGVFEMHPSTESYFLLNTTGGPFAPQEPLATETVRQYRPLRCSTTPNVERLKIEPNPVLTCREPFLSGGSAQVEAEWNPGRVGDPVVQIWAGSTRVVASGTRTVRGQADGLRNGMPFFTKRSPDGTVFASNRVYLLPNRSCTNPKEAPEPMIRATRDCVQGDKFTLAMWAPDGPVEIRQGSAVGPKVARFRKNTGLFDVTVTAPTSYWLMVYQGGEWQALTSVNVDPNARCEQGGSGW